MSATLLRCLLSLAAAGPQSAPDHAPPAPSAPLPPAPADPGNATDGKSARGLLGIAESEAARTKLQLKEPIENALRTFVELRSSAPAKAREALTQVIAFGPDATPILLEILRTCGSKAQGAPLGEPVARALVGVFERTKNPQVLRSLGEALPNATPAVRFTALVGLESLDHPLAVEIVRPQLADADPQIVAMAVRVLGRQRKDHNGAEVAASLLRPLLTRDGAPLAEIIDALRNLGDKQSAETVTQVLSRSSDPATIAAAVHFEIAYGGRGALPALRTLLLDPPANVRDALAKDNSLSKDALTAVQRIGLREVESHKPAEDILVDCFTKHPSPVIKDAACWKLGPYQNAQALAHLQKPFEDDIKYNLKNNRKSCDLYLNLADVRLKFEVWNKAVDALTSALKEDDRGALRDRIEQLRAVAFVGLQKPEKAEPIFAAMKEQDRLELLDQYPILERQAAKDPKFRALFPIADGERNGSR